MYGMLLDGERRERERIAYAGAVQGRGGFVGEKVRYC